jgi:hypothetical protein
MWQDVINGMFESFGGFFILFSCIKLFKQKKVRGVSLVHISYFTLWGFWNPYYYSHLQQWTSLFGGSFVVVVNLLWLILLFYYIRKEKNETCNRDL